MANAKRDENRVPSLLAVSDADGETLLALQADPTTKRLKVAAVIAPSGGGVTEVVAGTGIDVDDTDPAAPIVALDATTQTSLGLADTSLQPSGALGTPSSGTLTNCTGLPVSSGISGLGTGVSTFLATPSSANLAAALTDKTGTGSAVFSSSPSFTTPNIGAATATSVNGTSIPSTVTLVSTDATQTLTNKRITKRFVTVTQSATPAINTDNMDIASITGLAQAITSMTTNLTGTPTAGQMFMIQITDNGTARPITWGASFAGSLLPTTTVISTLLRVLVQWNATTSKWDCIATL